MNKPEKGGVVNLEDFAKRGMKAQAAVDKILDLRREAPRLLAKCLAYHDCGKPEHAALYLRSLVSFLKAQGIATEENPIRLEKESCS